MLRLRDVGPALDGQDIYALKLLFLEITAEAAAYGIFLCIAIMSTYTLIAKGLGRSKPRQALLAVTLTMLIAATAHLGLHMTFILIQFPTLAAEYVNPIVLLHRFDVAQTCLRRLVYFLSDIIVVWRAWVIWSDNVLVHCLLAFCLLATGATSLTLAVFNVLSIQHGHHYTTWTQNFLGTFGLLVTNFGATSLISYKLWYYRTNVKKYINRGSGHTMVESVLVLLIESGSIYCVFWILLMVGDFGYYKDFGFEWFQPNVSGIYPTIMIYMVSRQKTLTEDVLNGSAFQSNSTEPTIFLSPREIGRSTRTSDTSEVLSSKSSNGRNHQTISMSV
ncbi:hypothetical protein B0H10DRAFT_1939145 [Mycena sp. CBHHK59/15]|nr:hypothetical protein B0H10DRAFT_1939145 [Mycena sp. CBHHK59/15]